MNKSRKLVMHNNERSEERKMKENFRNSENLEDLKTRTHLSTPTTHISGITLVALVVTIIVLLILAGVTITALLGDDGIIKKAQNAADSTNSAVQNELSSMNSLTDKMNSVLNGIGGGGTPGGDDTPDDPTKVSSNLGTVISNTENTDLTDSLNNKITVPAGFYIVTPEQDDTVIYDYSPDGTPTVQDGIVIQNQTDGNQFVWVPVGTINNKESDPLGATTTIQLGRYSDFTMSGTTLPTPAQEATASSANTALLINTYFFEVSSDFIGDSNQSLNAASSYGNTKATNLQEWIDTTLANGGYYIARYEASQNAKETTKAASVKNVQPWIRITQPNAAIAAKATYAVDGANRDNYYSDLINSYAWDTAIVFIQAYEDNTYASSNDSAQETTTGGDGDQVCNINDMSVNKYEWTTETSTHSDSDDSYPFTLRGGYYYNFNVGAVYYTSSRNNNSVDVLQRPLPFFPPLTLC